MVQPKTWAFHKFNLSCWQNQLISNLPLDKHFPTEKIKHWKVEPWRHIDDDNVTRTTKGCWLMNDDGCGGWGCRNYSKWCHIGQQMMMMTTMSHVWGVDEDDDFDDFDDDDYVTWMRCWWRHKTTSLLVCSLLLKPAPHSDGDASKYDVQHIVHSIGHSQYKYLSTVQYNMDTTWIQYCSSSLLWFISISSCYKYSAQITYLK